MSPDPGHDAGAAGQRLGYALRWLEHQLGRRSVFAVGLITGVLAVLKSGIDITQVYIWPLAGWPDPAPVYPPLTYGFRLIAKVIGTESREHYNLISLISIAVVVVLLPFILKQGLARDHARWVVIVVMSGPMIWILSGGIGRTDPFIILGGTILAILGHRIAWVLVASVLSVLGNPEQAVIMTLCLLLVSASPRLRDRTRGAAIAVVVTTASWASLNLWSRSLNVPSRTDYFGDLWKQSLTNFFVQIPLELYAGFGFAGIVVAWAIVDQTRWRMVVVLLGAVVIPLAITALTLDQTRVLVCCSAAAVAALVHAYGPAVYERIARMTTSPLALTFVVTLALPAIELAATKVRTPWESLFPYLQAYVLGQLPLS